MAGSRLDALVAEKVMGWELSPTGKTWRIPDTTGLYVSGWNHKSMVRSWSPTGHADESESLLEKMRELGWNFVMESYPEREREMGGFYFCQFYVTQSPFDRPSARSNNRLESIVIAALRAVGVPESDIQEAMRGE